MTIFQFRVESAEMPRKVEGGFWELELPFIPQMIIEYLLWTSPSSDPMKDKMETVPILTELSLVEGCELLYSHLYNAVWWKPQEGTFKVAVGAQKGGGESDLGDGNLGNDYYDV